jgi:hypothetical protein
VVRAKNAISTPQNVGWSKSLLRLEVIKIDTDNRYEYARIPLIDFESKYIYVPMSIITNTELDIKRVGIFSYLRIHCGLNDIIGFTIPDTVVWCGGKPDRKINSTNDKFLTVIDNLNGMGYLTYITEKSKSSYMKCRFNTQYYFEECSNGYAALYLDEIDKILNYKKTNYKDSTITNTTILLVFAYFRNKIIRRPNELKPEERSPYKVQERKKRIPDAYNGNINDVSDEIGISSKTLSKIIDILEYDLNLIVTDRAYRVKNEDNEFRTLPTIFANAYKREDKYLLATGEEYSRTEIESKAENMKKYYQDYKINKTKRKNNKKEKN